MKADHRIALGSSLLRALLLGIGLLVGVGCGDGIEFDAAALWPGSEEQSPAGPAASPERSAAPIATGEAVEDPSAGPRDSSMQSVGPDGSSRVYYQFIDDRGRVQFVERLADVPAAWRDRVGYVEMDQPPPLTPLEARRSWRLSADRTEEILLASASPATRTGHGGGEDVLLYWARWCGYCKKAQAHLDRARVDYEIRDVDIEAVGRELREKTGRGGIPVLDFSGEILRGYSASNYDRAIDKIRG